MTNTQTTPAYRFTSGAAKRLLSDTTRMTDHELVAAAADPKNIWQEGAKAEIRRRELLGQWAELILSR